MFIILVLLFLGLLYFIYKNRAIAPSEPAKDIEAAVVALGAANAWAPLGAVSLGAGDSIQVEAPLAPLYLVPALLAAAAWLALGVFDAPASARI